MLLYTANHFLKGGKQPLSFAYILIYGHSSVSEVKMSSDARSIEANIDPRSATC